MSPSSSAVIVFEWTLITLSALVVSLKGYSRRFRQNTSLQVSDYFILAAWLVALAIGCIATRKYATGQLSTAQIMTHVYTVSDLKFRYAMALCYDFGLYLSKASLLAFYFVLIPKISTKSRIALWVVLGYVVCAFITTCSIDLFICRPITEFWSIKPGSCNLHSDIRPWVAVWTLNITCDLAVFILPFPVIWNLKLGLREKRGLLSIFSLGAITMAVSVARFISLVKYLDFSSATIFSATAFNVSIIVVALPSLNVLLKRRRRISYNTTLVGHPDPSPSESLNAKDPS